MIVFLARFHGMLSKPARRRSELSSVLQRRTWASRDH